MHVALDIHGNSHSVDIGLKVDRDTYCYEISWVGIGRVKHDIRSITMHSIWRWHALINKAYPPDKLRRFFANQELQIEEDNAIGRYESDNY